MREVRGLFEVARERMRTRHFAPRTKQAYLHWIRHHVRFHVRQHPRGMGAAEVEAFLTWIYPGSKTSRGRRGPNGCRWCHADVRATMIYTHVMGKGAMGVKSPLDRQLSV